MSTQLKLRRDSRANLDLTVPVIAEPAYDTTNKRLNMGDGSTSAGIALPNYFDIQNGTFTTFTAGGTADAITIAMDDEPTAYATGQQFVILPTANNTGAVTLKVGALAVKNVKKDDGTGTKADLEADDIKDGFPFGVFYDGTDFIADITSAGGAGWELVSSTTVSSPVSAVELVDIFEDGYDYQIVLDAVTPSVDDKEFRVRVSDDSGATFEAGAIYHYFGWYANDADAGENYVVDANNTFFQFSATTGSVDGVGSTSNESYYSTLNLYDPHQSTKIFTGHMEYRYFNSQNRFTGGGASFSYDTAPTSIDSLQFFFDTGNVESGVFRVYRKAIE